MQDNFYVDANDILTATRGGLDIILYLYPQAASSVDRTSRKFKVTDERTASASLKKTPEGNWLVTDFGDDQKPRNGIMCFMKERGLEFVPALRELAVQFNVVSVEKQAELIKAAYSDRKATDEDKEGTWSFNVRDKSTFTSFEIEAIVSKKILDKLKWKSQNPAEAAEANKKIQEAFQEYNWHPLESYEYVKNRKVMTYSAHDQYPMFLIDEGTHKKIYQPKHPDKGRRFMYSGEKPNDFIHGLKQLTKAYEARKKLFEEEKNEDAEDDDRSGKSSKKSKDKDPRLPEVILVTGGSDGINVALTGYRVIWMNSETAKLHQYQYDKIALMVEKFYQLPDIDATGKKAAHELNMLYLDMYCIELPEELKKHKDARGHNCKDVRDYFNHYKPWDFRRLVEISLPYRFWEKKAEFEGKGDERMFVGYKYEFKGIHAFNFLAKNGFGRLYIGDKKTEWIYVRQQGNTVYETDGEKIQMFIHNFLKQRQFDTNLREAITFTSKLNNGTLVNLEELEIDFTDHTKDSQFIFFKNFTVEVTADNILYHKPGAIERYQWEEDVMQHNLVRTETEPFTIKKDFDRYDITINDNKCPWLQYLVQTSRVHWRDELEKKMLIDKTPEEQAQYRIDNRCRIDGPALDPEQIDEQKQNLVMKLFIIGYLLHRFKARAKPWFVWAQDNKITEDGKSHGGSGKSILYDMGMRAMLKKSKTLNGRNNKLNDDQFKYDGVTEHTRYILVDDAHEYLRLDPFYKDFTGDLNVNPKGKTGYEVPFEKSAKFAFTSNFAPRDLGPSTERRMLDDVFSDYYHNKGQSDDYNEKRDPTTDIGLTLFTDFEHGQWNSYYQVMLHALKFYLSTTEKLTPAMGNANKRNLMAEMGNFYDWALVYFSEESDRRDRFISRHEFQEDYRRFNGKDLSAQKIMDRLRAFCRYQGYICNPILFLNKDKKIIKKEFVRVYDKATNQWYLPASPTKSTQEMLYIQTTNEILGEGETPAADGEPEDNNEMKF